MRIHGVQPGEEQGELWGQVKIFLAEETTTWLQEVLSVAACVCECTHVCVCSRACTQAHVGIVCMCT